MTEKKYYVEVYGESRNEIEGPWTDKAYTLKGARVVARRIVNASRGEYFADIVTRDNGQLFERIVA